MSWLKKLQQRWNAKNVWQVIAILLCFALTGTTVVWLMKPLLGFIFGGEVPLWAKAAYYIFILPVYNLVLLFYGFIFGQFHFFLEFEKRFFKRIASLFQKN
ncbi:MAG TPA: DUF6787 family protein [Cyclobacteriaceae bacterium]|jgi:hypothetical protein|nr:DUF6787 family protein [Cyclobacteriaceae bacterium]